jgi:hypothetical protein
MTRCPEHIAVGRSYARCHKHPGHRSPHHAAGRTWHDSTKASGCESESLATATALSNRLGDS